MIGGDDIYARRLLENRCIIKSTSCVFRWRIMRFIFCLEKNVKPHKLKTDNDTTKIAVIKYIPSFCFIKII